MSDAQPTADSVDDLAEEFARRWRDGERPSVEEYVRRYPHWEADIRVLFPAIVMMEQLKPRPDGALSTKPPPADYHAPDQLGDYRILREIGRGGMGVVYEAQHEALGRRVAVKVLPAHLFLNEKLRSRFRRESQAAARLHHTHVVPVFGVGEQNGACFYVMQLIRGQGLDVRPQSDHRAIASIGYQVADALAYAHGRGVLHRDIKPSNLLVDDHGSVWVTDFGVAKMVEEAHLTQSGELVGTLRYMPPERFQGMSDARGDVYSLGITLYELLARRPPFPATTPHHLIQLITEQEPPALRSLDPTIPADLETIVQKAAARDPALRYQTAAELADDLRRFLDDRPVLARRASGAELAWRWCKRNRLVASLGSAAACLLVITSVVSVSAYFHAAAATESIKIAFAAEQAEREHAEKTSGSALAALNRIYDRFAPNRMVVTPSLPTDSSGEESIDLPAQPVLSPAAVSMLEELLDFYEQLAREGSDYPKLRLQAAEANQRIGDIRQKLGGFDQAIVAYRKAVELYVRPATEMPEAIRIKLARTYNELGRTLQTLQRNDESDEAHGQALTTLNAAPSISASRPEYRYELARTYYFQACCDVQPGPLGPGPGRPPSPEDRGRGGPREQGGRGRGGPRGPGGGDLGRRGPGGPRGGRPVSDRERFASRQAVRLLEKLVEEHASVPEYRHLLACCYRDVLPDPENARGPGYADSNADRAIEILRQLVHDFPKVPDYRHDLCETLARIPPLRRSASAAVVAVNKRRLEEALVLASALVAEYPNVPQYAASQAQFHDKLSFLFHQTNQWDLAVAELGKAVTLQASLVKQHSEVITYRFSLAVLESMLARLHGERSNDQEARKLYEGSSARLESMLNTDQRYGFVSSFLARNYRELAQVLNRTGDREHAAEALRKAEEFSRRPDANASGPKRGRDYR